MSKDFIPSGESTGAVGKNGYQDFVPAPVPVMNDLEPEVEVKPSKSAAKRQAAQKKAKKEVVAPVEALGEPEAPVESLGDLEPEVEVK